MMVRLRHILFLCICYGVFTAKGQTILTFQEIEQHGLTNAKLDSVYLNAIKTTTAEGVFTGTRLKKFDKAWRNYYAGLLEFINQSGLTWGKPTYCLNKFFFAKDGKVDYWLFTFKVTDNVPQEKQDAYRKAINEYAKTKKINIKAKTRFAQCASVDFMDK